MRRKRGNPNFGRPVIVPQAGSTAFEYFVARLGLSPGEYATSIELREWVRRNKDHKYVPSAVLNLWGLQADVE
jgi:hypothetical protein